MTAWVRSDVDGVAVLTFTRPPANWMNLASMTELAALLEELAADESATVVMLTGGVDGYFIAHADLDDLQLTARGDVPPGDPDAWPRALSLLTTMPQPTVAAIDGQAWGGGLETALACTMRICSPRSHLALPEVSVGIIPGAGGTQRLPRVVAPPIAAELITSGRRVFADEALRIGLVNAVLDGDDFVDAAIGWCSKMARWSRPAVIAAKQAVVEGLTMPLDEGLRHEFRLFRELNSGSDARRRNEEVSRPD